MQMVSRERPWKFTRGERAGLFIGLFIILGFGVNLEQRTALRRAPMTDLGVFSCAAWGAWHGENIYNLTDWHGWHYQYPPTLAILFAPLENPLPAQLPRLSPGEVWTEANTPWGYPVEGHRFFGLHEQNARFFWIVAVWYLISVVLVLFSAHALGCVLDGTLLRDGPPPEAGARRRWWTMRLLPLIACIGSVGTEFSRGQVDVLMLAAVSLGLYLAVQSKGFLSGLCFSFPAVVKMFPPFLLLYPFWRRQWRMAIGIAAGLVLALGAIPALALGPSRTLELYRTWVDVLAKPALGKGTDTSRAHELTGMTSTDNQSLLAFIHNWQHHDVNRLLRPPEASPAARQAVYVAGTLMLAALGFVSGLRRRDSAPELVIFTALLVALWLVVSPIVHNFYYFLLMPLIAGLLDRKLPARLLQPKDLRLPVALIVFMSIDIATRLPHIGHWLRDAGAPLLSVLWLSAAGALVLLETRGMPPQAMKDTKPENIGEVRLDPRLNASR
jgi:hypothetical protein